MISFTADPIAPFWQGIFYTLIFVVTNVLSSITSSYHQHRMSILGMRIRTCLLGSIYRKSLVLAMHSKKDYTTGEVVNLMAVDSQRYILYLFLCTWKLPFTHFNLGSLIYSHGFVLFGLHPFKLASLCGCFGASWASACLLVFFSCYCSSL